MATVLTRLDLAGSAVGARLDERRGPFTVEAVYDAYAPFVWRSVCRLGVSPGSAEDVVQEIFLVVHRRLHDFEEKTSIAAWLFAIVIRVVRGHRRTQKRKNPSHLCGAGEVDPDSLVDPRQPTPLEAAERHETVRTLYAVLDQLNGERREVFVLAELEQLTAPEIAHALDINLNTVYWRLRTARGEFEKALMRRRAAEERSRR
jgi:RNA polymerase sigma-70 factor (ECF subfamily)